MIPLPAKLKTALDTQLNVERLNSAYYDVLATWCEYVTFDNSGRFFRDSAKDEMSHYKKFCDYLIARNEQPLLTEQPKPLASILSLLSAFQAAAAREAITTQAIDELYDLAEEVGDNATCEMLLWFIKEQVDSERQYMDFLSQLKRVGVGLGEQWFDEEIMSEAKV